MIRNREGKIEYKDKAEFKTYSTDQNTELSEETSPITVEPDAEPESGNVPVIQEDILKLPDTEFLETIENRVRNGEPLTVEELSRLGAINGGKNLQLANRGLDLIDEINNVEDSAVKGENSIGDSDSTQADLEGLIEPDRRLAIYRGDGTNERGDTDPTTSDDVIEADEIIEPVDFEPISDKDPDQVYIIGTKEGMPNVYTEEQVINRLKRFGRQEYDIKLILRNLKSDKDNVRKRAERNIKEYFN